MFTPPDHGRGHGRAWILGLTVALIMLAAGAWLLRRGDPGSPAATSSSTLPPADTPGSEAPADDNASRAASERANKTSGAAPAAAPRATREAATRPDASARAAAPTLHVESDIPGAMVFLDRKYLGTTPLVSRDVTPGAHQLNVQVEHREPSVQTVEIAEHGDTRVAVTIAAAVLNERVAVVHKHATGSCEGTLVASRAGLRYDTPNTKDAFAIPFSAVDTFAVDYASKNLRVKQRGGRTWNFTTSSDSADPLFVFHRDVEAARD